MHARSVGKVYVRVEKERLQALCVFSFFPSLSECLFLDRFEGQGLATGGEKAVFPFKREAKKKKEKTERGERRERSSRCLFTMKRRQNAHHPLKALTPARHVATLTDVPRRETHP